MENRQETRWLSLEFVQLRGGLNWHGQPNAPIFEEKMMKLCPDADEAVYGQRLRLEPENDMMDDSGTKTVLFQVLASSSIILPEWLQPPNPRRHPHMVIVKPWLSSLTIEELGQEREVELDPMLGNPFRMMLDRPFNFFGNHAYSKHHLVLAVSRARYDVVSKEDDSLDRMLEDIDYRIGHGLNEEQISSSSQKFKDALTTLHDAFKLADFAKAIVKPLVPASFRSPLVGDAGLTQMPELVAWRQQSNWFCLYDVISGL